MDLLLLSDFTNNTKLAIKYWSCRYLLEKRRRRATKQHCDIKGITERLEPLCEEFIEVQINIKRKL